MFSLRPASVSIWSRINPTVVHIYEDLPDIGKETATIGIITHSAQVTGYCLLITCLYLQIFRISWRYQGFWAVTVIGCLATTPTTLVWSEAPARRRKAKWGPAFSFSIPSSGEPGCPALGGGDTDQGLFHLQQAKDCFCSTYLALRVDDPTFLYFFWNFIIRRFPPKQRNTVRQISRMRSFSVK